MSKVSKLQLVAAVGFLLLLSTLYGCATIIHGSSQEIGIQSQPTGAMVSIDDGAGFGTTPFVAKLKRKKSHTVHLTLDGFQPFDAVITRSTSGWIWGNVAFGGLIGLAIDAISGSMYKLKPEQVDAELAANNMSTKMSGSDIIITVVLEPDPAWEKIGNLVPNPK